VVSVGAKLKEDLEPVGIRETNASEPFEDASLKIIGSSKPGALGPSGISLPGA
jgi:hypothetical protein